MVVECRLNHIDNSIAWNVARAVAKPATAASWCLQKICCVGSAKAETIFCVKSCLDTSANKHLHAPTMAPAFTWVRL
jgi:hypothetical protein